MKSQTQHKIGYSVELGWDKTQPNYIVFCYPRNDDAFCVRGSFPAIQNYFTRDEVHKKRPLILFLKRYPDVVDTPFAEIAVQGLKIPTHTILFYNPTRIDPLTNIKHSHSRCYIVVRALQNKIIFCKQVRRFHRGWMSELDPYVIGVDEVKIVKTEKTVKYVVGGEYVKGFFKTKKDALKYAAHHKVNYSPISAPKSAVKEVPVKTAEQIEQEQVLIRSIKSKAKVMKELGV